MNLFERARAAAALVAKWPSWKREAFEDPNPHPLLK